MGFTGTIFPDVCNCVGANGVPTGAGFGCVLLVIQQLFHFLMYFGVLAAVAFIAYAGFLLIINPTNPGNVTKGRTIMLDAVIGLVVVLAAWLIVNTLFSVLTTGSLSGYTAVFGSTSGNCLPTATDQQGMSNGSTGGLTGSGTSAGCPGSLICTSGGQCAPDPQLDNGDGSAGAQCNSSSPNCQNGLVCDNTGVCSASQTSSAPVPSSCSAAPTPGGGKCSVQSSGPCSIADPNSQFVQAFGANSAAASEVCGWESGNNPQNKSKGDVTSDGNSYSIGLFQINLTNSFPITVDGQNCSAAFSNACQGSAIISAKGTCNATVTNKPLYDDCVAAAQNAATNISVASQLSNGGSNWGRWANTAKQCGV